MRINTNIFSMMTQHRLEATTKAIARSLQRLGSGNRINSARDDAAGLAVSSNIESSTRATARAIQNLSEANGMLQVADGALATQTEIVQRMRELALQSANGALGSNERAYLQTEFAQLMEEFDRIATSTDFFGTHLLDGSFNTVSLMVGSSANDTIEFSISSSRSSEMFSDEVQTGDYARIENYSNGTSNNVAQNIDGDFNNDGYDDLLTVDNSGVGNLLLNDGAGNFDDPTQIFSLAGAGIVQTADVNNDGNLDLFVGKQGNLYLGDGEGGFSLQGSYTNGASGPITTGRLADLNDDGYLDLVYGYLSGTGKVAARYGTSSGFSSTETVLYNNGSAGIGFNPSTVRITDIDGDGRLDIHASGSNAAARYVLHNNGNGTFTTSTTATRYNGEFYDFNGDGYEDHLISTLGVPGIQFNNQAGGYDAVTAPLTVPTGYDNTWSVLDVRDADGDGDLDFIAYFSDVTATNPSILGVYRNDGHGTFTLSQTMLAESGTIASFMNLDGNDTLEFVTNANSGTPNIAVYSKAYNPEVVSIATQEGAQDALEVLSNALSSISANRANIGAVTNRLEFASSALGLQRESLLGAKSRILDADIAQETSELVRLQVLQQAQVAVLGQNNLSTRAVLKLLENI